MHSEPSSSAPCVVTLFVEARLVSDRNGRPASADVGIAGASWASALPGLRNLRLAARVDKNMHANASEISGIVITLPYYVGVRGMILSLPLLVRDIDRAVKTSDVVVARLPGMIGLIAMISATLRNKRRAAEVVGDIGEVLRAGVGGNRAGLFAPLAEAVTAWAVSRAMAVRYVTRSVLQRKYPARRNAQEVSFSGVTIHEVVEHREQEAQEPGLVLAIGTHEQLYKGHQYLLEAIAHVARTEPGVRLELIGEGRHQDFLRTRAAELGIEDRVLFRGYVGQRDLLLKRIDSCEVFVMPSLTEGLPRSLIEAMSRRVPCVATRVGGIPELLEESMLCAPKDSVALGRIISSLLRSSDLREAAGARNSTVAQSYSWALLSQERQRWSQVILGLTDFPPSGAK